MKVADEQLIAEVARVWVDGGGDAEGLDWCHQKLKEAVNSEIGNREDSKVVPNVQGNGLAATNQTKGTK